MSSDKGPKDLSDRAIKTKAANALSGKQSFSVNKVYGKLLDDYEESGKASKEIRERAAKIRKEQQGPLDWTHNGLRSKYRGERERENAWLQWKAVNQHSMDMFESSEAVLPIAKVYRHPMFITFHNLLEFEDRDSLLRTKNRLKMKKFVLDVQELWLTNLQHLREHRPTAVFETKSSSEDPDVHDNGLVGRRDTDTIMSMNHQIPAVSAKRALGKAYYTNRMPEPKVVIDYQPLPTCKLLPPVPLPPALVSLVFAYEITFDKNVEDCLFNKDIIDRFKKRLYVDRLMPSAGYNPRHFEVLWRVSILDEVVASFEHYVVTEKTLLDVCQDRIYFSKVSSNSGSSSNTQLLMSSELVYSTGQQQQQGGSSGGGGSEGEGVLFDWQGVTVQAAVEVSMEKYVHNLGGHAGDEGGKSLVVQVIAKLKGEFSGVTATMHLDTLEILALLEIDLQGEVSEEWWFDSHREMDLWPKLFAQLGLMHEIGNVKNGPRHLVVKSSISAVDGDAAFVVPYKAKHIATLIAKNSFYNKNHQLLIFNKDISSFSLHTDNVLHTAVYSDAEIEGRWEWLADTGPNESLKASQAVSRMAQVPGACEIGKKGLEFLPPVLKTHGELREFTETSANYFRDPTQSTTNSVLVNLTLMIDTPRYYPTVTAWEEFQIKPAKCQNEECFYAIPFIMPPPASVLLEALVSPVEARLSATSMAFSTMPIEGVDYLPTDTAVKPWGYKRHMETYDEKAFRQRVEVTLLGVDPVLPTIVFGITKTAALPNVVGINPRNIWHGTTAVTENINRPRVPRDYHYIVANLISRNANDPSSFLILLHGPEFFGLFSEALNHFEGKYSEILERKAIFARQLALDNKIEQVQNMLKTRDAQLKIKMRNEIQRQLEKKLRKATKSEKGWRKRYFGSTIIEIQKNWERRKDDVTGMVFFHQIMPDKGKYDNKEKYLETCQWEVPPTWDGNPLLIPDIEGNLVNYADPNRDKSDDASVLTMDSNVKEEEKKGVKSASNKQAFAQPPEQWLPGDDDDERQAGVVAKKVTPGTVAKGMQKSKKGDKFFEPLPDFQSTGATQSLSEEAPASINTVNLEHIAEQLLSSDELMRILAKRLGLPADKIVPTEDLKSIFTSEGQSGGGGGGAVVPKGGGFVNGSGGSGGKDAAISSDYAREMSLAPRKNADNSGDADEPYEPEMNSDDEFWSDEEDVVGDTSIDYLGPLPQNPYESSMIKRHEDKLRRGKVEEERSVPSQVPYINLAAAGKTNRLAGENIDKVMAWRRLPRAEMQDTFFKRCVSTKTCGPDENAANTYPVPIFLLPIAPVDACSYTPENFSIDIEVIFIPDAKKDMERAIATLNRNMKREEELSRNIPTDDLLLFGEAKESTTVDQHVAKTYIDDQQAAVDPATLAIENAIMAAKSNNIAQMEDALEENIRIDTNDQFGNTLLILACQQGSKRMCKFLLRRGANVNLQNLSGNTGLHYCFAYGFKDLAEYLKTRGANDALLNVDGLTCYEGLSNDSLNVEG